MQLDTRTLVLMIVAISFTLSIAMIFISRTRKTYAGFGLWTAGNGAFAVGFLLVALRGIIPDILTIVIANAVLLLSSLLYFEGIRKFYGMPGRKNLSVLLIVLLMALQSYFTFARNDVEIRIIIVSIFLGFTFGVGAVELFRNIEPDLRSTCWFTGSFLAAISLFMFIRAVITYLYPGPNDFFLPSQLQSATFIISGILGIAWTIGFINMNSRRLELELKSSQDDMCLLYESSNQTQRKLLSVMEERNLADKLTRIRLNLFEYSISHSLDELLQKTIDEVCELTGSPVGFYHFVEKDQKTLTLQAWSTRTIKEFCKAEGKGLHYGIDKAGVWVDCVHERKPVIHNDYSSLPHRRGMPEGHAAIIRELVVPIMRSDKIVAILGIGNKSADYKEKDIEIVSYLADVAWEIAERRQAEMKLVESEERYRNLFENATEGIYISTPQGRYVSVNPAFAKILGFTSPEEILDEVKDIGHQIYADAEERRKLINLLAEQDRADNYEVKGYRKDGQMLWVSINAHAVRDENGVLQFIEGTMNDITVRKEAEEKMQAAQEERERMLEAAEQSRRVLLSVVEDQKAAQEEIGKLNTELEQRVADRTALLEAANKELEAFSYSVSHDLRSPLQHITGFAELLNKRAGKILDEKSKHYLKVITDSTIRMGTLIEELLAFSRMGRTEMLKKKTYLGSLVNEILKDFQADTMGRNIDWKIGPLPEVYGDRAMLKQVFVNLISNACKFTQKRGDAAIEIGSACNEKGEVFVYVKDNGAGFDMKYVDKLFGIFQRLHRTEEFEGTGIGLANVRRIIHRHGGKVWAEGKEGEGATFFFTLKA